MYRPHITHKIRQMHINSRSGKHLQGSALELLKFFKWCMEIYSMSWNSLEPFLCAVCNVFFFFSPFGMTGHLHVIIHTSYHPSLHYWKKDWMKEQRRMSETEGITRVLVRQEHSFSTRIQKNNYFTALRPSPTSGLSKLLAKFPG